MKYKMIDFDFVFISFDEPNAEILYADLLNQVPWAKRVHGVVGFDSAHRVCADVSDTDFFVTVDGDNRIYPEFLDQEIDIDDVQRDHAWTWAGRNFINGLVYGNGGLKLWSKDFVYGMNSHENATDPAKAVDFCWDGKYHDVLGCYSESITNASAYQAWRSGFREGVKMSLDQGNRVKPREFHDRIWSGNINRLCIWASIGRDVEHGIWAMYGARLGCYLACLTDDDYSIISHYDAMKKMWETISQNDPEHECKILGDRLREKLNLDLSMMMPEDSKFFKKVYMNPPRPWIPLEKIQHFMATKYV